MSSKKVFSSLIGDYPQNTSLWANQREAQGMPCTSLGKTIEEAAEWHFLQIIRHSKGTANSNRILANNLPSKETKQKESRYSTILNVLPELLMYLNPEGSVLWANQAVFNHFKRSIIGISFNTLWYGNESPNVECPVFKTQQTGRPHTAMSRSQYRRWCLQAYPHTERGNIAGIIVTARNHTQENENRSGFSDGLTDLYNRDYLEVEMKRLDTKRQLPLSLIMADLNGLKLVNDVYGHAVGDQMLIKAAEIIKKSCRAEEIVARWGGDEFVILLPRTDKRQARNVCRRITSACQNVYIESVPISIALGAACKETPDQDIFSTLKTAEDNMYSDKLKHSNKTRKRILSTLLQTLARKSSETAAHVLNMQKWATKIASKLNLPRSEHKRLNLLIALHDIGKVCIKEDILTKKGHLDKEEWQIIKQHPEVGYRLATATGDFAHIAREILTHHEWWDGSGYPLGLKGEEIPLLARITAIVDAYDVMIRGRPHKRPFSQAAALAELEKCAHYQFDPHLVDLFAEILNQSSNRRQLSLINT